MGSRERTRRRGLSSSCSGPVSGGSWRLPLQSSKCPTSAWRPRPRESHRSADAKRCDLFGGRSASMPPTTRYCTASGNAMMRWTQSAGLDRFGRDCGVLRSSRAFREPRSSQRRARRCCCFPCKMQHPVRTSLERAFAACCML